MKSMIVKPGHGESFAGPIGGDTHPNEPHSTRGDDLSANHCRSTEMQSIQSPHRNYLAGIIIVIV